MRQRRLTQHFLVNLGHLYEAPESQAAAPDTIIKFGYDQLLCSGQV
jgi:hypothetical protein